MEADFSVTTITETGGRRVLRPVGELDLATVPSFAAALNAAVAAPGCDEIVIDLNDLGFIDACGITALVRAYLLATSLRRSFRVRNPHGEVDMVLRLVGVADRLLLLATPPDPAVPGDRVGAEAWP